MNGTAGVVASVVVLKKRRKSNTSSFTVVKEKVEVAANVVANQLLGSVVANIRKKRAYCALCSHLLFCGLFLLVLFLQRDTAVAFNVERVLTDSMFSEASSTVVIGEDVVRSEFDDADHFYRWWASYIGSTFPDVPCGDSVCSAPQEFAAFDRFGCAADCGTYDNTTAIQVEFRHGLTDAGSSAEVATPLIRKMEWNLCSKQFQVCLFEQDQKIDTWEWGKKATVTATITDGAWELTMRSQDVGIGATITDSTTNEVLLEVNPGCVEFNSTDAEQVEAERFAAWNAAYNGDDDGGGGGGDDDPGTTGGGTTTGPGSGTTTGPPPARRLSGTAGDVDVGYGIAPRRLDPGEIGCDSSCTWAVFKDSSCDAECNTYGCDYDGGDCCPASDGKKSAHEFTLWKYGDEGYRVPLFVESSEPRLRPVGRANLIVGGVLVSQQRAAPTTCGSDTGRSMTEDCVSLSTSSSAAYGVDPVFLSTSSVYNSLETADGWSSYYEASQISALGVPYGFFPLPASSNKANAGAAFALFWDVNVGATRGSQFVTYMKEGFFIDDQTTEIEIEFVTFNPALQLFAYVYAQIDFHVSGRIMLNYAITSLDLEPWTRYTFRVCVEALLGLCIVCHAAFLLRDQLCPRGGREYRRKHQQHMMWTMIEFCNVTLMAAVFVARVHHYLAEVKPFTYQTRYELYGPRVWTNKAEAQPFMLETNESEYLALRTMLDSAQRMANFQSTYLSLCGIITMLLILRLLKLLDFQPRLGLVTRTLSRAAADLSHFCLLFACVVGGFAITGHVLFGSRLEEFKSVPHSVVTCLEVLVGEIQINEELMLLHDARFMGQLYFWSFVFVAFFLLVNVLLAIIVEAYVEVKKQANDAATLPQELAAMASEGRHKYMPKACRKQNTINPHASRLGNDNPPYRSDKELLAWFMKQLRDNPALWNGLDADTANDAQVEVTGRSSKPSRSQSGASGAKAGRGAGKPQGSVWDLYAAVDEQNTLVERALPLGSDMLLARDTVEQLVIQSGRQTQVSVAPRAPMLGATQTAPTEGGTVLDNLMLRFGEVLTAQQVEEAKGSQRSLSVNSPVPSAARRAANQQRTFAAVQELETDPNTEGAGDAGGATAGAVLPSQVGQP